MHGRFTDSKFLRGGADRRLILYDVLGQLFGPLLHVPLQMQHSPPGVALSYAKEEKNMKAPGTTINYFIEDFPVGKRSKNLRCNSRWGVIQLG